MGRTLLSLVLVLAAAACTSAFVAAPASALAVRPATAPASPAVSMTSADKKAKAAKRKVREPLSNPGPTAAPLDEGHAPMAAPKGKGAERKSSEPTGALACQWPLLSSR